MRTNYINDFCFLIRNTTEKIADRSDFEKVVCNREWSMVCEDGEKVIYRFLRDGSIQIIRDNGDAVLGKWTFMKALHRVFIVNEKLVSMMMHFVYVDESLLVLLKDVPGSDHLTSFVDEESNNPDMNIKTEGDVLEFLFEKQAEIEDK